MFTPKEIRDGLDISQDKLNRMVKNEILKPERNPGNEYRLFSDEDMRKAMIANAWLELGLNYSEIVPLLSPSNNDFNEAVKKLQKELDEKIAKLKVQSLACEMLLLTGSMDYVLDVLRVSKQDELIPKVQKAFSEAGNKDRRQRQESLYADPEFNHGFRMLNNLRKKEVSISHDLVQQYVNLMVSASEKYFPGSGARHLLAFADVLGTTGEFSKGFEKTFGKGCTQYISSAINIHLSKER